MITFGLLRCKSCKRVYAYKPEELVNWRCPCGGELERLNLVELPA